MAQALDLVHRASRATGSPGPSAGASDERNCRLPSATRSAHEPTDLALFERALTHSSRGADSYERLEFLGDRVLGLVIARWLYERFPGRARGQAVAPLQRAGRARDLRAKSGASSACRRIIRLGKQAREDGANGSDNVVGDVVEALIGALFLDGGLDAARCASSAAPGRALRGIAGRRAQASQVGAAGTGRGAQPGAARI